MLARYRGFWASDVDDVAAAMVGWRVGMKPPPHRAEHFRTPAPPLLFYSAPAQQALGPT